MARWSDEQTERLRDLRAEGLTLSQCAKVMGITHHAACGKWDSLNGRKSARKQIGRKQGGQPSMWTESRLTEKWSERRVR